MLLEVVSVVVVDVTFYPIIIVVAQEEKMELEQDLVVVHVERQVVQDAKDVVMVIVDPVMIEDLHEEAIVVLHYNDPS